MCINLTYKLVKIDKTSIIRQLEVMCMVELDFLELDEIIGEKRLELFNKIGVNAKATDFAIMLGAYVPEIFMKKYNKQELYTSWWTKNNEEYVYNYFIDPYGQEGRKVVTSRLCGARPVIKNISKLNLEERVYTTGTGITCVHFGEYPQFYVGNVLNSELSHQYIIRKLKETGRVFTVEFESDYTPIQKQELKEYEYKGKKYVKVRNTRIVPYTVFSNGTSVHPDASYWFRVEPITWIVDKKSDIAISKNVLFSGIQYNDKEVYGILNFEDATIKKFMDTYFKKEMIADLANVIYDMVDKKDIVDERKKINPYNFDFSNVSEEEIIKGCVESNIAVMLHGRSGDGKSARVKELDPNAEILYLINASPDSLSGKSIVYNGKMIDIPPTWYTRLVSKCESEPDKIHIVFFDEITNAPPSIQGMAFNIILDKEVNGKWKLPDNARIVAAGNELEESRSAYGMSEPLFNRFAHVYIETKVEDFLSWASTRSQTYERLDYKEENVPMKIHPSIYAFILYKGESVLRTKYTGVKPNADPRKWEMASKVLYKTNKPEMIRSLVGEEVTQEFINFCKQKVITLEDVINGNYTTNDLNMDTSQKYNTAVYLSKVSFEQIEIVREFIKRLGEETCALFDTLWSKGQEERLEKIQEIKLSEKIK